MERRIAKCVILPYFLLYLLLFKNKDNLGKNDEKSNKTFFLDTLYLLKHIESII